MYTARRFRRACRGVAVLIMGSVLGLAGGCDPAVKSNAYEGAATLGSSLFAAFLQSVLIANDITPTATGSSFNATGG